MVAEMALCLALIAMAVALPGNHFISRVSGISASSIIKVMGTAADPIFAMEKMKKAWPDVIVLNVEMPRKDCITFLKKVISERPTPVVICSTLTEKEAETTMQTLASGAVGVATKPKIGLRQRLQDASDDLIHMVKAAARANVRRLHAAPPAQPKFSADAILPQSNHAMARTTDIVVAIGTSTGGTQALEAVLTGLPRVCPGIVVVLHMPEKFTEAFAGRLDGICQVEVKEAKAGDRVLPGTVLIGPGGRYMLLKRNGAQCHVEIVDGPPVSRHGPSVDVLFRSVAQCAGKNALGIIMTGIGDDGANGLLEMRQEGANTVAQDEASCVVYGMPKEAVKRGGVGKTIPLGSIANEILQYRG